MTGRGAAQARADFLIWRSPEAKKKQEHALIVVECKADNVSISLKDYTQGANYAQYEHARFFVTHNHRETRYWKVDATRRMPNYDEIANIPHADATDKQITELLPEHFISLRFTGEIENRDLHGKSKFMGGLSYARPGDIIYSKIDVRNGAIGIVPPAIPVAAVTSEFPVYQIKKGVALPEYIQLVFRTEHFRRIINGMVSGASGRKRVQPSQLESVEVPLPALAVQRAIVSRWRMAQDEITRAEGAVLETEAEIRARFLADLGLKSAAVARQPRAYAVRWQELFGLSVICGRCSSRIPCVRKSRRRLGQRSATTPSAQRIFGNCRSRCRLCPSKSRSWSAWQPAARRSPARSRTPSASPARSTPRSKP